MNMRRIGLSTLLVLAVAGSAAMAAEVIVFTNGATLVIRGHEYDGDLIRVDLGDNGFMSFPKSVVDRIEEAPGTYVKPSTVPNQIASGSEPVFAMPTGRKAGTPFVTQGLLDAERNSGALKAKREKGLAVDPMPGDDSAFLVRTRPMMSREALRASGPGSPVGGKIVMPNSQLATRFQKTRTGVSVRPGLKPLVTPPPANTAANGGPGVTELPTGDNGNPETTIRDTTQQVGVTDPEGD